ncbi:AAA family ATPase [Mycobacterium kansasii]
MAGNTTRRGYGNTHQKIRDRYKPLVASGQATCWRCIANGKTAEQALIHPSEPWDLGHDDHDRNQYRGPEHRRCNRATKGRDKPTHTGRLILVIGPPAAGKSTWVRHQAQPGDITIDFDAIANVLTPPGPNPHDHPQHIKAVTKAARKAAIDSALTQVGNHAVYVIHSTPSPGLLDMYRSHGAEVVTIDPGEDIVMARCKAERPWRIMQAAKQWYASKHDSDASKLHGGVSKHADNAPALRFFDSKPNEGGGYADQTVV